jgi:hypothetical protein
VVITAPVIGLFHSIATGEDSTGPFDFHPDCQFPTH